jgi:hypothetical protein
VYKPTIVNGEAVEVITTIWSRAIGYAYVGYEWTIALKTASGNENHDSHDEEVWGTQPLGHIRSEDWDLEHDRNCAQAYCKVSLGKSFHGLILHWERGVPLTARTQQFQKSIRLKWLFSSGSAMPL